ncbi:MAG: putative heme transporter [Patescibacteria group bacterium]|nr:putative heme transporter [Patescibacteria group bacterium]
MSFRFWATTLTLVLITLVVYFGWSEITEAWNLIGSINLWLFMLIIPVQLLSYFSVGEIMFSYLRAKGDLKRITRWQMTRVALESNFVNHIVPVPAAAGFSYLNWVFNRFGVSGGRATMAQIIRVVAVFVSFVLLVIVSVLVLSFDNKVNKTIVIVSLLFIAAAIGGTVFVIYSVSNHKRLVTLSAWLTKTGNKLLSFFTRGKKKEVIKLKSVEKFFIDIHQDYLEITRDKKILIQPMLWATLTNILDVSLIAIAFYSLGFWVNPAVLFIAFGLSSIAAAFMVTPGGAGVYEAIMIGFLTSSGMPTGIAIAGTLLARSILLILTISFGYIFYQLTINKYGKISSTNI